MSEAPAGDGTSAPAPRRKRRWPKVLLGIGLVLLLLVAAGVVGGGVLLNKLAGNVQTLGGLQGVEKAESYQAMNVLVMGTDDRSNGNSSAEQATEIEGQRSDTTILVHISADRTHALAVSIPRDTYLELPACASQSGNFRVKAKFNSAFTFGGPSCTVQTVEELTGVSINHAVVVDFKGFKNVVNALGGVQVCLTKAVKDPDSGLDLPAGWQTVQGDQALAFVRARKSLGDGSDIDRLTRQQQFLASAIRQVTDRDLLTNPAKLYRVLDAATASLSVDSSLDSLSEMVSTAESLRGLKPENITFVTMPFIYAPNGSDVLVNEPVADEIWTAIGKDEPWPPAPDPDAPALTVAPQDIRVVVENGNGKDNAATDAAADLRAVGFVIAGLAVADAPTYTSSLVRYNSADAEDAKTLAASVPGAVLQLDDTLPAGAVHLVVGSTYTGAKPVDVARVPEGTGADPAPSTADQSTCSQ